MFSHQKYKIPKTIIPKKHRNLSNSKTKKICFFLPYLLSYPTKTSKNSKKTISNHSHISSPLRPKKIPPSIHSVLLFQLVFEQIRGGSAVEKLHNAWQGLQANVDHLMDREMSKTVESENCQGLKQLIEKKEGIIRMHMMGKRVNFAARSVITPDPNINIDEIGIPEAFALKLTYPVPVTPWNVTELRQLIINGPDVHPGAVMIEAEDGWITRLNPTDRNQPSAIAKRLLTYGDKPRDLFQGIKIVHRHLQNGDLLLLNRQPTLHKPSIMAHKARILKGEKTLRLHYANCKAYNADFDGDEMNAHYPQNELARSEGYFIANVENQYLVPKDGTPLSGLIQDHVISGVCLSLRGNFFDRNDYMELVYTAISDCTSDISTLPPTIIKPVPLWSGKQIISTVIINSISRQKGLINLNASAKISAKEWEARKSRKWKCGVEFTDSKTMSEAEVIIRNGELLCGVLDKTHYGATPYGLIHCVYELYGGHCSSKMLSAFGKLFQAHLYLTGFTLGIKDIEITDKNDKKRQKIVAKCRKMGDDIQKSVLEVTDDTPREIVEKKIEESYWSNPRFRALVDRKYKGTLDVCTNDINKTCLPAGLLKKFPDNNLQLMVQSGAKGSSVNTMQISCLLGQIELEGQRPPLMINGKSLPSFVAYDSSPRSGGFIDGRFMTGIQPQEFFFHCMAGREGLIDTAVKTSRSGYLQRCLIKHLEGLSVNYDLTVRDSDGSLVQFHYGEDGLDVSNSRFLRERELEFLVENRAAIMDPEVASRLRSEDMDKILKIDRKIKKWRREHGDIPSNKRPLKEFTKFSADNAKSGVASKIDPNSGRSKVALSLMKKWVKAGEEVKKPLRAACARCPDPVMSVYRQDLNFGVLSERLDALADEYCSRRADRFTTKITKEEMRDLLSMKIVRALCPPGEPVGLLAAQSIGEPSTQLTLNTFHFAGRGEMNVTLGIPRLREILMMATKNIKTPSMEIPFRKDLPGLEKRADRLRMKLTKCHLSDVLEKIEVESQMTERVERQLEYTVTLRFLKRKAYKGEFCVHPKDVVHKTERSFFDQMFREFEKQGKAMGTRLRIEAEKRKKGGDDAALDEEDPEGFEDGAERRRGNRIKAGLAEDHESSDEEIVAEDADATSSRTAARRCEAQEYEDPEEEEVEDATEKPDDEMGEQRGGPERRWDVGDVSGDDDDDIVDEGRDLLADEQRKKDFVNTHNYALEYDYDTEKFLWCKLKFWVSLPMIR